MKPAQLEIHFDGNRDSYRPGEILSGEYRFDTSESPDVVALEVSVLWHTEGKGDEDISVHLFNRFDVSSVGTHTAYHSGRFSTQLPNSPLSYEGVIVKIRWCVRIRVFDGRGKDVVAERPFRLGLVAPARAVLP